MQEKKILLRKEDRKERKTVESYYYPCTCSCTTYNCNPCDSVPSTAYLTRKETLNDSRRDGAYNAMFRFYN